MNLMKNDQKKESFRKVGVYVRLATADDLKNDINTARRLGQPFWVKSAKTDVFDNAPVIIDKSTNLIELKTWLDLKMLWVPANYFELKDHLEKSV